MPKRVTLKDVARRSGVSYQTVSKILHGTARVSPQVHARVIAAIEELGYHPNIIARNLRTKSSYLIGYSWQQDAPTFVNPVLEQFLQSIVETAEVAGYHILLFPVRPGEDVTAPYTELVKTGRVDGFVLSSLNYSDPRISLLDHLKVPFVAFGRAGDGMPFPYVDVDNCAGVRAATHHVLSHGHRRVGVIAWPESSRVGNDRLAGYLQAMQQADLQVESDWIVRGEGEYQHGYEAAMRLLSLPEQHRPTAIVTLLDVLAIGAMQAAHDLGLVVGTDIAITGFDDTPIISYLKPSLTSVRQPVCEIGRLVIEILVSLLKGVMPDQQQILLEPELIVRESSAGFNLQVRPA